MSLVAGLDVGTTTIRVALFDGEQRVAIAREQLPLDVPFAGAVEQNAAGFVEAAERLWAVALAEAGAVAADVSRLGIANQRATIVCWSSATGEPLRPAVGWQDTRTKVEVARFVDQGIPVNTNASCTKMTWLLEHDLAVAAAAADGTLRMGTVDAWMTWALSGGEACVTEPGNAAATGLYDARSGDWSDGALDLFAVPRDPLPSVVASDAVVGSASRLGGEVLLAGRLGDQMAACAAHGIRAGEAKLTLGTSAMLDVHAGPEPGAAPEGCYMLPLWRRGEGDTAVDEFLFEGSINTAGSVIEWLVRVGLLDRVEDLDAVATAGRVGSVAFVPALAGRGSPRHEPDARATWTGLALDTTREDMVRAAVEGIAERVAELAAHMGVAALAVDGGLSRSDVLLAAIEARGLAVTRGEPEATVRGAALIATPRSSG
ncbi:MAG: FGGY family carbohydrate kinase [Acidimicrobiales bacterium]|nr:FGGY family carbohydrate kinase [Acidimicrobiales bacterium]